MKNKIDVVENLTAAKLTDMGICPTCYDRAHNHSLFGDPAPYLLYTCKDFEVFLAGNPRANGHTIISSAKHYKDMMEAPLPLVKKMYAFAQKTMIAIKKVYKCESVYLCTMCDGPMNHFHLQLIPRYSDEPRGKTNFVKERKPYKEDKRKLSALRKILNE